MKTCIILANGFEEMEAVGVIDILRRGNVEVEIISIEETLEVTGAHNIEITCNSKFNDNNFNDYKMIVLPGGLQGVNRIKEFKPILSILKDFHETNRYIGAICAAPIILEEAGIIKENNFTCYKGFEKQVANGKYVQEKVVEDKNIITSNCVGSVFDFGFKLLSYIENMNIIEELRSNMIF